MSRFYALVVKPGTDPTPFVPPPDGEIWHLRHAAMPGCSSECPIRSRHMHYASLFMRTSESPKTFLGTLGSGSMDFMRLDFPLNEYTEFFVEGNSEVHFSGCLASEDGEFNLGEEDAAEMQALEAALMRNGRGRMAVLEDDSEDTDSSEEEPDLTPVIEELTSPMSPVKPNAKTPSPVSKRATKASKSPVEEEEVESHEKTTVEDAAEKMQVDEPVDKKAAKRLKRKQRREAKAAAASEREPLAKQQKINPAGPQERSKEKLPKASTTPPPEEPKAKKKRIRRFSNGYVIENLSYGPEEGPAVENGSRLTVKYKASLEDGTVFDKTAGNQTFTFVYGKGEVVKGLDKGLDEMRVGDKRRLTVPPKMGYASQGALPAIPPDAWLSFDIELMGIEEA